MRYSEILNEMIWEDKFTAGEAVKRFPNALIHFTKIPKLGVNPTGNKPISPTEGNALSHSDPPGIYFYPCRYLMSEEASSYQYANSYPYYYVCSLTPTKNTLNVGTVSTATAEKIAKKNGWFGDMQRIRQDPTILKQDHRSPYENPKLFKKPGGFMWACMHYLASVENKSWIAMLRGIDVITDPGFGIIASQEPAQTIVFNRKLLKILAHGENKDVLATRFGEIAKAVAPEFNAKVSFKNKNVIIDAKGVRVILYPYDMFYPIGISKYEDGFWVTKKERSYNPDQGDIANFTDSVRRALRSGEGGSGDAKEMHWTGDVATQIIKMVKPAARRFGEYVKDGKLHISYSDDSSWIFTYHIGAEITKEDTLTMSFIAYIDRREDDAKEIRASLTFGPNVSPQAAGIAFKNKIVAEVKGLDYDSPKKIEGIEALMKHVGFDL
jgi:hypothetical protein